MIYELTREIATELAARGVPYPVIYGPERGPRPMVDSRLVVERNRTGSDELAAPRTRQQNPRIFGTRWIACTCTIFAKSNLEGAGAHDHEREVDQLVDKFTIALHKAVRVRNNQYRLITARLLSATELALEGLEAWQGAVYRIEFAVDRGVPDTNWQGAAKATAQPGSISTALSADGDNATAGGSLPAAQTR